MKTSALEKNNSTVSRQPTYQRKQARVFVLHDHLAVSQGIIKSINQEQDLHVCGEAENYQTAVDLVDQLKPDVVLIDISLNGSQGIEFLRTIKAHHPNLPALILSMHDEMLYAERVIQEGAKGYVMKQEAPEKILTAIRKVLAGQMYLSETTTARLLERKYGGVSVRVSPIGVLSDRELEVFRLIGEGKTTSNIAKQFHRSIKTVETYRSRIKNKLCLKHNLELIRCAMYWLHNEDPQRSKSK